MELECNREAVNNKDNSSTTSSRSVLPDTNHPITGGAERAGEGGGLPPPVFGGVQLRFLAQQSRKRA